MPAKESSTIDFGLLIAYVLPGFTALWGTTYISEPLRHWLGGPPANGPTIGGFLYMTVGSIAAGLTVSTVRWLLIDTIHHHTGIKQPAWDFSLLQQHINAYTVLIEIHYSFYQFYANMLVSLTWVYVARRVSLGWLSSPIGWVDLGFLLLAAVFYLGSRDTLKKYYSRTGQFLRARRRRDNPKSRQAVSGITSSR